MTKGLNYPGHAVSGGLWAAASASFSTFKHATCKAFPVLAHLLLAKLSQPYSWWNMRWQRSINDVVVRPVSPTPPTQSQRGLPDFCSKIANPKKSKHTSDPRSTHIFFVSSHSQLQGGRTLSHSAFPPANVMVKHNVSMCKAEWNFRYRPSW